MTKRLRAGKPIVRPTRTIVRVWVEKGTIEHSYDVHITEHEVAIWPQYINSYGNVHGRPPYPSWELEAEITDLAVRTALDTAEVQS